MASRLSLLSDEEIVKVAAFDITDTFDLHDPRFGSVGSLQFECPTCGMYEDNCIGHHALLSLRCSIFHPLIHRDAERIINRTCFNCYAQIQISTDNAASQVRCMQCGEHVHTNYMIKTFKQIKHAQENPHAAVRVQKGHDNSYLYPEQVADIMPKGYVVSKVLVPPVHLRTPEDVEWSSDMQRLYEQLVQYINKHKYDINAGMVSALYSKIIGSTNSEGVIGLISKKEGICRKIMLGKRLESSARSVIAPDPCIALDEVAVPKVIADEIRISVTVTEYNIIELRELAAEDKLWWNASLKAKPRNVVRGMKFLRAPKNGDLVMFNRQPSLSRESMLCFKVVLRNDDYSTLGMNPQIASPFNADFDGDEMNIFFMNKSADMMLLCHIYENFSYAPVQDVVTGCYMMSKQNAPVSKAVWQDCMMHIEDSFLLVEYTTHTILRACIPGYDGSQLTKQALRTLIAQWAKQHELHRLHVLQKVILVWLAVKGLTVPISSVIASASSGPYEYESADTENDFRNECFRIVREQLNDTQIMDMIDSGAKGSIAHASNMAVALGQQYILGRPGVFCRNSYSTGLTPIEFFGHQMAAREGVVSTGVSTSSTGYLNRRVCTIIADVIQHYTGAIGDGYCISTFPSIKSEI